METLVCVMKDGKVIGHFHSDLRKGLIAVLLIALLEIIAQAMDNVS